MSSTRSGEEEPSTSSAGFFSCVPCFTNFSIFGERSQEEEISLLSPTIQSEEADTCHLTAHDCKNIGWYLGCAFCLVGASYALSIEGVNFGIALLNPGHSPISCTQIVNPVALDGAVGWTWLGLSIACEGCLIYGSNCMTLDCYPEDESATCFIRPNWVGRCAGMTAHL